MINLNTISIKHIYDAQFNSRVVFTYTVYFDNYQTIYCNNNCKSKSGNRKCFTHSLFSPSFFLSHHYRRQKFVVVMSAFRHNVTVAKWAMTYFHPPRSISKNDAVVVCGKPTEPAYTLVIEFVVIAICLQLCLVCLKELDDLDC